MSTKRNRFAQFVAAKPTYSSSEPSETAPEAAPETTPVAAPELSSSNTLENPEEIIDQSNITTVVEAKKTSAPKTIKRRGKEKIELSETAEYTTAKVNTAIHKLIKKNVYFNPEYGATIQEFVENAITHYDAFIAKKTAK